MASRCLAQCLPSYRHPWTEDRLTNPRHRIAARWRM